MVNTNLRQEYFIEDDIALLKFYAHENGWSYPRPSSDRRIGYVSVTALKRLSCTPLRVRRIEKDWRPAPEIIALTQAVYQDWLARRCGDVLFDGDNMRAAGLVAPSAATPPTLLVQRNRYQDYARTNLVLDARLVPGTKTLREYLHHDGRLEPLDQSALANNLGINLLIINEKGEIPLQVRANRLAVRPGQVCASASGTMQSADIPANECDLLDCDLLREAREELGDEIVSSLAPPKLLGLGRELARGGQLEIFLMAKGRFDQSMVKRSNATAAEGHRKETQSLIFLLTPKRQQTNWSAQLATAVDRLELEHGGRVSAPLRAHLALWVRDVARCEGLTWDKL